MAGMTHRERALTTIRGGQADYVPTFELVFHETERDFDGRALYGIKGGPDPTGVDRDAAGEVLGVSFDGWHGDRYPVYPTPTGRRWGTCRRSPA